MNLLIVQKWFHPDLEEPVAASGSIAGTCAISFGEGSSTLKGAGALAGSADMVCGAGSSTLKGAGALAGATAMVFGAGSSTATGAGALAGATAMVFGAGSSTAAGAGALAGSAAVVFDATGAMSAPGDVAGVAAMTFGAAGDLISITTPALDGGPTTAAPAGRPRRRRRYVFPDGTVVMATEQEALDLLGQYARLKARPLTKPGVQDSRRPRLVKVPRVELARVEWKQAADTAYELIAPVLPPDIVFEPDKKQFAQAIARLKRKLDDEEAILALLS